MVGTDDFDVGKQYAVIIGIDKYVEWPSLRSAAAEARDVRRLCLDVLPKKVGLKDSLLIFYAGHGYLDDSRTGFWIALDGTKDVYNQQGWIPDAQLRNYISALKVQRVLLIADACFSGDFLNVTRGTGRERIRATVDFAARAHPSRGDQDGTADRDHTRQRDGGHLRAVPEADHWLAQRGGIHRSGCVCRREEACQGPPGQAGRGPQPAAGRTAAGTPLRVILGRNKDTILASAANADDAVTVGPFPMGTYQLRLEGAGYEKSEVPVFVFAGRDVVCVPLMRPVREVPAAKSTAQAVLSAPASSPVSPAGVSTAGAKAPAGKGMLSLVSDPPGIVVAIDEDRFEKTPIELELSPGAHSIKVERSYIEERYYVEQPAEWVSITDGGSITIPLRVRQGSGEIDFARVPAGYTVFAGDDKLGVTPSGKLSVPTGAVKLRFERAGEAAISYIKVVLPETTADIPWGSRFDLPIRLERRTIDLKKPETWSGIPPVLSPASPMRASAGILTQEGMGITKVYICRDDKYLYWRIDFEKTNPLKKPPKGTKKSILTKLSIETGMRTWLNIGLEYRTAKSETGTFMGIWSGVWNHIADNVITYQRDDAMLVQRISYDKATSHVLEGIRAVSIDLAHDTGSGWEYGAIVGSAFYIDFRK